MPINFLSFWSPAGTPWMGGIAALLIALLLTPIVDRWARWGGWIDVPSDSRWRNRPVALLGGVAIAAAVVGGVLAGAAVGTYGAPVWVGAALVFGVGLADDLWDLRPEVKLVAQVAAAALLLYAGHAFWRGGPAWVSVPLTFLWVIGVTNAVNLIDGIDGLAAGVAAVASVVLALLSGILGLTGLAAVSAAVAGASLGFLVYNAEPARIFMGDCGSLLLGYLLSVIALGTQETGGPVVGTLVPIVVLAVPIFDTIFVTVTRILRGQSVAEGGNDHTHHRLVRLGLSEPRAVLVLTGLSAFFGVAALLLLWTTAQLFLALVLLGGVVAVGVGMYLAGDTGRRRDRTETNEWGSEGERGWTEQLGAVMHAVAGGAGWKSVVGVAADLLVVMAALVVAAHLRFGGQPPEAHLTLITTALPAVAAGKVLIFSLFGLYHGVWRHAGTPEVVRLVCASAAASVATGTGLLAVYGIAQVSGALLVIDWLIATVAVGGLRFGFRALRQYFAAQREGERRVVVYGSGADALLAVRHLRRTLDRAVVGLLDDNPDRHGLRTQGLRILGGPKDLETLADDRALDAVIVPKRATSPETRRLVAERSAEAGLACRQFAATLRPVADEAGGHRSLGGDGVTCAPDVPASDADTQGGG